MKVLSVDLKRTLDIGQAGQRFMLAHHNECVHCLEWVAGIGIGLD